jgi:hypothetical protein
VGGGERKYHVVITAQGTAVHWQARVHYYWYRKARPAGATPSVCERALALSSACAGRRCADLRALVELAACEAVWE